MEKLRLELKQLEELFFINNTHAHNKKYKMLPFNVTGKDYVVEFTGVVSELIRVIGDKKLSENFDLTRFNIKLKNLFNESEEKEELLNIINKLFVNNGNLAIFDLKSYNYIKSSGNEVKIAQFLFTVLIDENEKNSFQELTNCIDSNVLHRLVYDALPKLEQKNYIDEYQNNQYECIIPFVKIQFSKDFAFLVSNQDLIEKYLKRILEYYYMFYVTQLAIKLNHFEKANFEIVEKVYMTLSWEVTSETRRSNEYGWQYVKEHLNKLFSHAITFEVLANNNVGSKYTYKSIHEIKDNYDNLINDIDSFIEKYKQMKSDVDFSSFKFNESERSDSELTSKAKELFRIIDFQFKNSGRTVQNKRYYDNILKFVHSNFGKRRGRLGYSFNITENDIIMFIQIILGQNDGRIRLVMLFDEFESRGLLFDRESKSKIVELLEKLNLLEKKSDSGDAQYVRSIL